MQFANSQSFAFYLKLTFTSSAIDSNGYYSSEYYYIYLALVCFGLLICS